MRNKQVLGFTLIELMIVVAIIAIIAAIAIPGLIRARISANEGSAIGSLRSISTSQSQFQSGVAVDQNQNGSGEYGLLNELCGAGAVRGTTPGNTGAETVGPTVKPSYLSISFRAGNDSGAGGVASKSGYYFQMFLPSATLATSTDIAGAGSSAGATTLVEDEQSLQENNWICYATPIKRKSSGIRVFCIDVGAEVSGTSNADGVTVEYDGAGFASMPDAIAGMEAAEGPAVDAFERLGTGGGANITDDGNIWAPTGGS